MRPYARFVATDEDKLQLLFRQDLQDSAQGDKRPVWLNNELAAKNLYYTVRWENVDIKSDFFENAHKCRKAADDAAGLYTRAVESLRTIDEAERRREEIIRLSTELHSHCSELRKWEFLLKTHESWIALGGLGELSRKVEELNSSVARYAETIRAAKDEFKEQSGKSVRAAEEFGRTAEQKFQVFTHGASADLKSHLDAINSVVVKCDAEVQRAVSEIKSSATVAAAEAAAAKKSSEDAASHIANAYLSSFSAAFNREGWWATGKGWASFALAGVSLGVLLCGGYYLTLGEGAKIDLLQSNHIPEWLVVTKWLSFRVLGAALLSYVVVFLMRERRNYLHIAESNFHRKNSCNAYLAVQQKLTNEERLAYLKEVLPHIANLGKTGFIEKEEVPEVLSLETLGKILEKN